MSFSPEHILLFISLSVCMSVCHCISLYTFICAGMYLLTLSYFYSSLSHLVSASSLFPSFIIYSSFPHLSFPSAYSFVFFLSPCYLPASLPAYLPAYLSACLSQKPALPALLISCSSLYLLSDGLRTTFTYTVLHVCLPLSSLHFVSFFFFPPLLLASLVCLSSCLSACNTPGYLPVFFFLINVFAYLSYRTCAKMHISIGL